MGIEPMTFPLPRECSTPELQRHHYFRKMMRSKFRDDDTVHKLITQDLSLKTFLWAGQDSNLRSVYAADLQSAPFAARDTDPI